MTRGTWTSNFELMVDMMKQRNFSIHQDELQWLHGHYLRNSPESFEPIPDTFAPSRLAFDQQPVGLPPVTHRPEVTHLHPVDLYGDGQTGVVVCDNERSSVSYLQFRDGRWTEEGLAIIPAPVHSATFDFEGDGDLDIAVAAMGWMDPSDRLIGEAHLLINQGGGVFEDRILLKGVARLADMQPGDFDGDGDLDFVLAMFGWRITGGLVWLEQVTPNTFQPHSILDINGPMRLQVLDYDRDGDMDFVTLVSQEHERIGLFTNDGNGQFSSRVLIQANHPAYGSSSFQVVDLDQDGDLDILATNGDMMDENPEWKPYHGARWFENVEGRYQLRPLIRMPGCYFAEAHDLDRDGDLDIVVSSMNVFWDQHDFPSLAWLENDGTQNFTSRKIDSAPQMLPSIAVADLNHDGIPDILGGGMHTMGPAKRMGRLTLWLGNP